MLDLGMVILNIIYLIQFGILYITISVAIHPCQIIRTQVARIHPSPSKRLPVLKSKSSTSTVAYSKTSVLAAHALPRDRALSRTLISRIPPLTRTELFALMST